MQTFSTSTATGFLVVEGNKSITGVGSYAVIMNLLSPWTDLQRRQGSCCQRHFKDFDARSAGEQSVLRLSWEVSPVKETLWVVPVPHICIIGSMATCNPLVWSSGFSKGSSSALRSIHTPQTLCFLNNSLFWPGHLMLHILLRLCREDITIQCFPCT